jgi:hypothetical protein
MARKVIVLHENGKSAGDIKRSVAYLMVRRLLWQWVQEGKIARILPVREIPLRAQSIRIPPPIRRYMPDRLPPAEVPQVHFKPPSSLAQWRDSHQEWLEALR